MSLADDILATDKPIKSVPTPEWGPKVPTLHVRTISAAERDAFELSWNAVKGKDAEANRQNIRARFLVLCISDAKGNRIFKDEDAEALGQKSAKVVDRLFTVAQRLNGMTGADVEELAKNS